MPSTPVMRVLSMRFHSPRPPPPPAAFLFFCFASDTMETNGHVFSKAHAPARCPMPCGFTTGSALRLALRENVERCKLPARQGFVERELQVSGEGTGGGCRCAPWRGCCMPSPLPASGLSALGSYPINSRSLQFGGASQVTETSQIIRGSC